MAILKSETIHNVTAYADAVQAGFTGTYQAWCSILGSMSGDSNAVSIQKIHYTLRVDGWSDHIYSFENIYPHDEYLFLFVDKDGDNMTEDDLVWWYAADMMGSTQNRIIAHGDVPETDLPVLLTIIKRVTLGG